MRISGNIRGTSDKPRIVVSRSSRYIYAQAIDDVKRVTLASFSSQNMKKVEKKMTKLVESHQIGVELAKLLIAKKIEKAVYDRSYYIYLGRVKALCEGLREGGIKI